MRAKFKIDSTRQDQTNGLPYNRFAMVLHTVNIQGIVKNIEVKTDLETIFKSARVFHSLLTTFPRSHSQHANNIPSLLVRKLYTKDF